MSGMRGSEAEDTSRGQDELAAERSFGSVRGRGIRTRASSREIRRAREWAAADLRSRHPGMADGEIERLADDEIARQIKGDPRLAARVKALEPTSRAPARNDIHNFAELAAAVALPPFSNVLGQIALTPSTRGPISALSGAAATLVLTAATSGSNILLGAFDTLTSSIAAAWALGHAALPASKSQRYRDIVTITGRGEKAGHDPRILLLANVELLSEFERLERPGGQPAHFRFGQVGIIDATRLRAPVPQLGPRKGGGHLAALRRDGMDLVEGITYEWSGRKDTVIGWKGAVIVDQATSLPLVWALARGQENERSLLLRLLDTLFSLWPDCPMHTIVGDAFYDLDADLALRLEECYSLHPVFSRHAERETTAAGRRGQTHTVIDGQPHCVCGPMKFRGRDDFYDAAKRLADGRRRGEVGPGVRKKARVRWSCPNNLCREVSLHLRDNPRDHTWWPRVGAGNHTLDRRALEIYRNSVEAAFAGVKLGCIGTRDSCALWARDDGAAWLLGLHFLSRTARRVAHETGVYGFFADEFRELGLHQTGSPVSDDRMRALFESRPAQFRWRWPTPGRTPR